jgi:hypothetical protein
MTDQIPQMQLVEGNKKRRRVRNDALIYGQKSEALIDVERKEPSVAMMLQKVIDGGITADNVSALESLVGLYDRMQAKQAEKDFAAALTELQGETIRVQATKAVDVKNGIPRYTFAPYEEIMRTVQPMLTRQGFSVTFDTKIDGDRLYSVCTLTHKSGHSRSNQFAVRFGKPPGSSDAQGDMSTKSYAKRGALCDALNISIDHDDDARMIGKPIGKAIAEDLLNRVKLTGSDMISFLKFAGVTLPPKVEIENYDPIEFFEQISDDRFDSLDQILKRKEAKV